MEYIISAAVGCAVGWLLAFRDTRQREETLTSAERALRDREETHTQEIARSRSELARERDELEHYHTMREEELEHYHTTREEEFERLLKDASELRAQLERGIMCGRRWLADAFAEFVRTRDAEIECALVVKPNPAWTAAETVAQIRTKRIGMARSLKLAQYQLASYEEYFPFLRDYRDAILDEAVEVRTNGLQALEDADPALSLGYLSKEEYDKLPTADKFQLALDRYWSRNKTNVEIGRLYERYIGYLYEEELWTVRYQGILKGFEDFGRDLICTKDGAVHIVQCKCWSKDKVIREKHIMQLFGSVVLYRITERCSSVQGVFVTPTSLSEEAVAVARELGITIRTQELAYYPMIKCNVNPSTNERIYHLPFDQQYDRILIGNRQGEFYAESVRQAEKAGFRRAYRWRGVRHEGVE